MEDQPRYEEKSLKFTYEEYLQRGRTIENLIIDKYIVLSKVGEGSNGQVYKGLDDRSKKHVAIKIMDMREINGEKSNTVRAIKQRLCESEPRLMFECNSPNLIKCLDVYRNDDLKVLVLEYCSGATLQKEIDDKRRIPEKEAIEIIKHLINGLMVSLSPRRNCTATTSSTATSRPRTS
jgi:serine/threonine protein kinase